MLSGYSKNKNGVIHQVNGHPIKYDKKYIAEGLATFPLAKSMGFLRLGFLVGSIKEIPSSICDIGYGCGDFLVACEGLIKNRSGIEINGWDLPPDCSRGDYYSYYDVFTFYDSLEHFPEIDFIKNLRCKYLVITVPSCNHGENDEWFSKWKHRKPNEHIWHFNASSLSNQMINCGFKHIRTDSIEDTIRKGEENPNIITGVFKKL
jgi:hypothetical protein